MFGKKRVAVLGVLSVCLIFAVSVVFGLPSMAYAKVVIRVTELGHMNPTQPTPTGAGMKAAIEYFESKNPDIEIKIENPQQLGQDFTNALVYVASGTAPNIMVLDRFLLASAATLGKFLMPLNDLVAGSKVLNRRGMPLPGAWDECYGFDGKLYGVPYINDNIGCWGIFYNIDLLEAGGYSEPAKTWQDFVTSSLKLTKKDSNGAITQAGYLPFWDPAEQMLSWSRNNKARFATADGKKITFNTEAAVKTLEFLADLFGRLGYYNPPGYSWESFAQGKVAQFAAHDALISAYAERAERDLNYGVTFYPTPTGKDFAAYIGGWSRTIPVGTKNLKETLRVLEYLCSEEYVRVFIEGAQEYAIKHHMRFSVPGAFVFTYPGAVQELHIPYLRKYLPGSLRAWGHFIFEVPKADISVRERTLIQADIWAAYKEAMQAAVIDRKVPARQILDQLQRQLQAKLDKVLKEHPY